MAEVPVLIPYSTRVEDLKLDSAVEGRTTNHLDALEWLVNEGTPKEACERIFRATTVLFAAGAGPFEKCLETAIIWECGYRRP